MAEKERKERLQLTFSMSSPLQRQAWELLCAVPKGERTREICRAVCQFYNVALILDNVRTAIREELRNGYFVPVEKADKEEDAGDPEDAEIADGFLDFMSALDDDDGDDGNDDGDSDN